MRVRTRYAGFLQPLERYYSVLLPILAQYQYNRRKGGSIIAVQIENEYGGYGDDQQYLVALRSMYRKYHLDELLCTSDGGKDLARGALNDVWATINFQRNVAENIRKLADFRPGQHLMIMEYWTGWFDYWGKKHQTGAEAPYGAQQFESDLEEMLIKSEYQISINFYMFFGGTNFGFMAGAHHFPNQSFAPFVTSYDYDAPISEAGNLTEKYFAVQRVLKKFYEQHPTLVVYNHERTETDVFEIRPMKKISNGFRGTIKIDSYKSFDQILADRHVASEHRLENGPLSMEQIKQGTSQGFIVYTNTDIADLIKDKKEHRISIPAIADNALALVNGEKIFQSNHAENAIEFIIPAHTQRLSIVVENMGRLNYGARLDYGRKGILDKVYLNKTIELKRWAVHLLDFSTGTREVTEWKPTAKVNEILRQGPRLFRGSLVIDNIQSIDDTFLLMDSNWTKGVAFLNGFNLGRYWTIGPQKTLFIPKSLFVQGRNHFDIFELFSCGTDLQLVDTPRIDG